MSTPQDQSRNRLLSIAREPLVHFLLLGGAIYLAYGLMGPGVEGSADDARTITVSTAEIGWLSESWQKRWNRPPTADELAGLIDGYVRETVFYREALAMGLDRDDTIIRRRLAQKLEFLSQDLVASVPPTDEQLQSFFDANPERYESPALMSLTQVFVDPDKRGDETLTDAEAIGAQLRLLDPPTQGAERLGDPFMLQTYYPERTQAELSKLFGSEFAKSVAEARSGEWQGPVLSGYGVHWIFVDNRSEAQAAEFADVRDKVRRDWADDRRAEFDEEFYENLRARYEVVIEDAPEDGAQDGVDRAAQKFAARVGEEP